LFLLSFTFLPESPRHAFAEEQGRLSVTGVHGKIQGGLSVVAFEGQVCAAEKQSTDGIHVSVLGGGVQGSVTRLLTDVRVSSMFEQQCDDPGMPR
jgi:hypothetical protein